MADEGLSVGSVSVDVVPNAEGFAEKLRPQIEAAAEQITSKIRDAVSRGFDEGGAHAAIAGAAAGEAYSEGLKARLDTERPDIKVGIDDTAATAELAGLKAEVDTVGRDKAKIKVDSSDLNLAEHSASSLTTGLVALGPALIPVTASIVGFAGAAVASFGAVALGAGTVALAAGKIGDEVKSQLTPAFTGLQKIAAAGILPGVQTDITAIEKSLPGLDGLIASVSTELGKLAGEAGTALGGSQFKSFFSYVDGTAAPILDQFGHIIGDLAVTAAHLAVAFAPVTAEVGSGLESIAAHLASSSANSQGLRSFVAYIAAEGPAVVHTFEAIGEAAGHSIAALAPIGDAVLNIVHGFADLTEHTPAPVIQAVTIALASYLVVAKAAAIATKSFGVSQEAASAAMGPVAVGLAAAFAAYTVYSGSVAQNAADIREAQQATDSFVASLHTIYTNAASVTKSLDAINTRAATLANSLSSQSSITGIDKTVLEIGDLGRARQKLTEQSAQAQSNEAALARQYGLTDSQVVQLAGGSKNLVGSLSDVGARFATLYQQAQATHQPLTQVAKDQQVLTNTSATLSAQLSALSDQFANLVGNFVGMKQAQLDAKTDLQAFDAALKKSNGSLSQNTAAGQQARAALLSYTSQVGTVITATYQQTNSYGKAKQAALDWLQGIKQSGAAGPLVKNLTASIQAQLAHLSNASPGYGKKTGSGFANGISSGGNTVKAKAAALVAAAAAALKKAQKVAETSGYDFGAGFAAGITKAQRLAITAADQMGILSGQAARNAIQAQSPSKLMIKTGQDFGVGFAVGIGSTNDQVKTAAENSAKAAVQGFQSQQSALQTQISSIKSKMQSLVQTLTSGLTGGADLSNFTPLGNITDPITGGKIPGTAPGGQTATFLSGYADNLSRFVRELNKADDLGLNHVLLDQIAGLGPTPQAFSILKDIEGHGRKAAKAQIQSLNASESRIQNLAGKFSANQAQEQWGSDLHDAKKSLQSIDTTLHDINHKLKVSSNGTKTLTKAHGKKS